MITTNKITCRICGNTRFKTLLSDIKTELGETYSVIQCDNCSFAFTHPLPSLETLKQYYEQTYWSRPKGAVGNLLTILFKLRMSNIIRQIKKLLPKGARILEWGAGAGDMVRLLNQQGFDCVGIDLYSVSQPEDKLINATIHTAPFENESFDAITCFHVLEHLPDPLESIKKALNLLKPNGILVIEVPNIDSIGFKLFKKRWQPLEIPTHINHFTLKSIQTLFKKTGGYRIIKTDYFSHRVSPSSIVLSPFPFFSARTMKKSFDGRYPPYLMALYLILQFMAYPFAYIESLLKKGAVIKIWACKTELPLLQTYSVF